ncbi:MAG: amidohydrolase family protein [Candidatus Aminicenantes bacterium]|jgi:aminocarboxymuconate-semialdehyde decarboxylase
MRIIDFHNHFFPPVYIEAVRSEESEVKVTFDKDKNPLLHYPGDYNIVVPEHRDIDVRAKALKKAGVDKQILTFTTPGVHIESPERAVELARMVNDSFAIIKHERGDQFAALATLPLNDPGASVKELERAVKDLGFKGAALHSNVNGVALSDERFWQLYEKANELGVVFDIHPSFPVGVEAMKEYWLMPLIGFPFDTTLAAAKLVFSGIVERYPNIKWVLGHLGGAIPYLAERLDRGFRAFRACRENISKAPSEYLKDFYYDTVNFDPKALQFAVDFAGADHLVAGSDYPHQIGSLESMVSSIETLDIPAEDKEKIFGQNAAQLLDI